MGCTGAEYYRYDDFLNRIKELVDKEISLNVTCYFVSGDEKTSYYHPSKSYSKQIELDLNDRGVRTVQFDIANVETKHGYTSLPDFYYWRNAGEVGWKLFSSDNEQSVMRKDDVFEIDTFDYKGLYKH